ncbi:hypothetical protein [Nitratireductor sp. GZWM139]|uniref:hypothetical protein n=1 Tax=Nitratireductor sp. GZWM139 TaxID=2950541 RepID=UPI0024BE05CE|nr:hypothetical protein [Nitratireductor sp. GZWM139]MDJ1464945.1 hypothetical protein [Nitratireductor sp. GZWM139]
MTKPAKRRYSNAAEMVAAKNHYTMERWGTGYAVTLHLRGQTPQTTLCKTLGEANRLRQQYASQGLAGWNSEAQ